MAQILILKISFARQVYCSLFVILASFIILHAKNSVAAEIGWWVSRGIFARASSAQPSAHNVDTPDDSDDDIFSVHFQLIYHYFLLGRLLPTIKYRLWSCGAVDTLVVFFFQTKILPCKQGGKIPSFSNVLYVGAFVGTFFTWEIVGRLICRAIISFVRVCCSHPGRRLLLHLIRERD